MLEKDGKRQVQKEDDKVSGQIQEIVHLDRNSDTNKAKHMA